MTEVDFYFDPVCPWTWMASRWISGVAPARDLHITWRTFSLMHRTLATGGELDERFAPRLRATWRGLRVIEAVRKAQGDEPIGRLYTVLGTFIHHDGDGNLSRLQEAVTTAGLDPGFAAAGDEDVYDDAIRASTETAMDMVGKDIGVPIIGLVGTGSALFGPVVSPPPEGTDALRLWDAFATLLTVPGFWETKRTRSGGPQLPARPAL